MSDETTTEETAAAEDETVEVPRDERREEIVADLVAALGDAVLSTEIDPGRDLWARVSTEAWTETAQVVRHRLGARYFGFLSAVDWMPSPYGRSMDAEVDTVLGSGAADPGPEVDPAPGADTDSDADAEIHHGVTGGEARFQLLARVEHIGEPDNFWGITLKADVPEDTMAMGTWTNVYAGADWHEREAWEMFGIDFVGHPGLRHIYLPSDFEGNPLRKDFPLLARMVKPWPGIVDVEALPSEGGDEGGEGS